MNSKGFEMAISTLILIAIGVVLLVALIYTVTVGFDRFNSSTRPFTETSQSIAVRGACDLACKADDKIAY